MRAASAALALREPLAVRWFSWHTLRATAGAHIPSHGEIWIADTLTPEQAAITTAHELRHAWQLEAYRADGWQWADNPAARRWLEDDAYAWLSKEDQTPTRNAVLAMLPAGANGRQPTRQTLTKWINAMRADPFWIREIDARVTGGEFGRDDFE